MVEAGGRARRPCGADLTDAACRALFDDGTRESRARRARYRPQIAYGADGGATARILALVRGTAGVPWRARRRPQEAMVG
jgi:hypothetical protein